MEHVPGGSVASCSKFKYLKELVRRYTAEPGRLHYLHCNRIVHRDIEGANVLVANDGTIKLADTGASRASPTRDLPAAYPLSGHAVLDGA